MTGVMRPAAGVVTLVSLLLVSTPSWAQSDEDRSAARALATGGVAAEEAGKWAEAIELFRRAEAIVHAPPHLLHIARAEAKLGRLIAAHEGYIKITREELGPNAPRAFLDAQAAAQKEMADLKPRIPSLKIVVEGGTGTVTMDGAPVPEALVGIARPVDPGRHKLQAKGAGTTSRTVAVDVAEGAQETVTLTLTTAVGGGPDEGGTEPKPSTESGGSNLPAYIAWGVGVVGVGVGTAMLFVNRGKRGDAEAICPPGPCPQSRRAEVEDLDSSADTAATISLIGYGVGIAGLGVGTVLFLLNRKSATHETAAHRSVTPWVGLNGAGLGGRF